MAADEHDSILAEVRLRSGPIEDHLTTLATSRDFPGYALAVCAVRMDEAGPPLRALLDRAAAGEALDEHEKQLLFCGLHLLGGTRDTTAGASLLRLLRRPIGEIEAVLDDAVTETLPKIVAGVFDGDAAPWFAAVADPTLDEYVRNSIFGALTFLTWEGRIGAEEMRAFLERFNRERPVDDHDCAWLGWQLAISLLGMTDLAPLVREAWAEGRICKELVEVDFFEEDLAAALRAPAERQRFYDAHLGYIDDVVELLEQFVWGEDEEAHGRDRVAIADDDYAYLDEPEWTEPAVNPWRNVGRNDPCPCGSGRKFKKCCLPRVEGEN